jgi:hypothetical protein
MTTAAGNPGLGDGNTAMHVVVLGASRKNRTDRADEARVTREGRAPSIRARAASCLPLMQGREDEAGLRRLPLALLISREKGVESALSGATTETREVLGKSRPKNEMKTTKPGQRYFNGTSKQ